MFENSALIFYYHRINSYSFNALAGAVDGEDDLKDVPVGLALTEERLSVLIDDAFKQAPRVAVAVSILTCQFEKTARLMHRLRNQYGSKIILLAGGPHVTACPEEVLQAGADVVFRGEAEITFPIALRTLLKGEPCDPVQAPPHPADIDSFSSISPKRGMFGPIEITRGCAFSCRYCQTSHIFGTQLRHRSIDKIVRQADALRSINRKVVRLLSPNALSYGSSDGRELNLAAIRDLLSALRTTLSDKGKIIFAHFPSEARPEHITPDTLALLKEFADNDEIVIGAQSGSPRMLEHCRRSHTVDDVFNAVSLLRKYGYKVIVDFIFGLPGETEEDMRESLKVMRKLVGMGARVHPHIFAPLPQTAFAQEPPGAVSPEILQAMEALRRQRGVYGLFGDGPIRTQAS